MTRAGAPRRRSGVTAVVGTTGTSAVPEFGGNTWWQMQYVLGLQRLGVDAFWLEHLPEIDPFTHHHSLEYLVDRFDATARRFGFADRYAIVYNGGEACFGASADVVARVVERADLLLALSGKSPVAQDPALGAVPRRAYLDVDPGFTQIWGQQWPEAFTPYDAFFTTGLNVGGPGFSVPTGGIAWTPMLPPVVLDHWPVRSDERARRYRTVADWRGSQAAEWDGVTYGGKREQFHRVLDLPERVDPTLELALLVGQHDHEDLGLLSQHGWKITDPYSRAGDPESYREFVQYSRAEFSVAKGGYVTSRGGWVSDRTACFLASGKPALVQSTGFEPHLPTGRGLLTFRTVDEAVEGIREIEADYGGHCRAARALAEAHFDSDVVLHALLEQVGL